MKNNLYTTSEFAKLCQTTKDTLFVYDKKGILKPATVGENGYRYYHSEQYYEYCVIKAFQLAGSSLDEIAKQLHNKGNKNTLILLKEKQSELYKRQIEIIRTQKFVESVIAQMEKINYDNGNIHVEFCPEEYFISMPADYGNNSEGEFIYSVETLGKLNTYIKERGYSDSILFEGNYVILRENFLNSNFLFSDYRFKIPYKANDPLLRIKPSGKYALKYVHGSFFDFPKHCSEFLQELNYLGYKTTGDFYVYHLKFNLFSFSESETIRLLSVKIDEK